MDDQWGCELKHDAGSVARVISFLGSVAKQPITARTMTPPTGNILVMLTILAPPCHISSLIGGWCCGRGRSVMIPAQSYQRQFTVRLWDAHTSLLHPWTLTYRKIKCFWMCFLFSLPSVCILVLYVLRWHFSSFSSDYSRFPFLMMVLLSWSAQYRSNSLSLLFLLLYLLKKQKQIRIYSMMPVGFTWYHFSFRMKSTAAPKSLMSTHMTYTLYYTSFMLYDALCEQQTQIKVTHCNKYVRSCMAKHPFLNIKFKNAWLTFQCFHWEINLSVPHIKIAYMQNK